jgi:hypothetical protein
MSVDLGTATAERPSFEDAEGVDSPSQPGGLGGFLSDVIVELGFADRDLVEETVNEGRQVGKAAIALLLDRGELTSEQLARAIAERNGLPFVDLSRFKVDETARQLIDRGAALRYRAIPIAFAADGSLVTALADPLDTLAVSDIAVMTKSDLVPVVADAAEIERLVEELPKHRPSNDTLFAPDTAASDTAAPASASMAPATPPLSLVQAAPPPTPAPAPPAPAAAPPAGGEFDERVVALVRSTLTELGASEIHRLEREVAFLRAELARFTGTPPAPPGPS